MKKKPGLFTYLFGNPRKDFSLKIIPGLVDDLKQTSKTATREEKITREEFRRRYRNLQWSYIIVLLLAVYCLVQTWLNVLWVNQLSALLASVLLWAFVLKYGFRLWVARQVFSRKGKVQQRAVSFPQYLVHCLKAPSDLLPLPLPSKAN